MSDTSGQLVTIDPKNALTLFSTPGAIDPILARIKGEIDAFVTPDVNTKKGRDELKSFTFRIIRSKTYIDDCGKTLVAELKDVPKKIDASRKKVRDTLDLWAEKVRAPLTAFELAEETRIKRHRDMIDGLNAIVAAPLAGFEPGSPLADMKAYVSHTEAIVIGPSCEEFEAEYARAKDAALRALRTALAAREKYDAEQTELARLRAAEAEREAVRRQEAQAVALIERERFVREREARIAAEAVEAERLRAERAAQQERDKAERERLLAEQNARAETERARRREEELKAQAEAAERRAAEAEARAKREAADAIAAAERRAKEQAAAERAEAERREENKRIAGAIHRKARAALIEGGMSEDDATLAVELIARRKVPNVVISY